MMISVYVELQVIPFTECQIHVTFGILKYSVMVLISSFPYSMSASPPPNPGQFLWSNICPAKNRVLMHVFKSRL